MENLPLTLGVKVVILFNHEALLVKHSYENTWGIPGGMIEKGEHPIHAGKREIQEELGIDVDELCLFGVYLNPRKDRVDYVFLYTVTVDHKPHVQVDNFEITDACWWNLQDISSNLIGRHSRMRLLEIWGEAPIAEMW